MSSPHRTAPNKLGYEESLSVLKSLNEKYSAIKSCLTRDTNLCTSKVKESEFNLVYDIVSQIGILDGKAIHTWVCGLKREEGQFYCVTIPFQIMKPRPFSYKYWKLASDSDRVVPVLDSDSMYLLNFDIESFKVESEKHSGGSTKGTLEERIIHGVSRQIANCIKLRATSPPASVLVSLLGYTCRSCQVSVCNDVEHRCWNYSSSLVTLIELLRSCDNFPFFYGPNGVTFNKDLNGRVSSMIPFIVYQLCELSLTSSVGQIGVACEQGLVECLLFRCQEHLFSSTFKSKDSYSRLRGVIEELGIFMRRTLENGIIVNVEPYQPIKSPSSLAYDDVRVIQSEAPSYWNYIKGYISYQSMGGGVISPDPDKLTLIQDSTCDDFLFKILHEIYYFKGNMLFVTGVAALALKDSAQGQRGYSQPLNDVAEYIELDGQKVPVLMDYQTEDLRRLYDLGLSLIPHTVKDAHNLESEFIELQTTNSSGMTPEIEKAERQYISDLMGNKADARLVQNVRKTRIVDVLNELSRGLSTKEGIAEAMGLPGKAGTRIQVYRRLRLIIMIRSVPQASGFLIMRALEAIYSQTPFSTSGKNTGDVRDMNRVLTISGTPYYKSSNDVKGMDASTKKSQLLFTLSLAYQSYSLERSGGPAFFLGSSRDIRNVEMVKYYKGENPDPEPELKAITLPQMMIGYAIMYMFHQRRLIDGTFNDEVDVSPLTFASGWWATSAQHNLLGCLSMVDIQNELTSGNSQCGADGRYVTVLGGVAGDDQVIGVKFTKSFSRDKELQYSRCACMMLEQRMNALGFICDPSLSLFSAEFLKQVGTCGAPEGLDGRICVFSSERGDQYDNFGNVRYEEVLGIIREKLSRTRKPELWTPWMYMFGWVLGIMVFSFNAKSGHVRVHTRFQSRRVYVGKPIRHLLPKFYQALNELGFRYTEWKDRDIQHIVLRMGPFWMCTDEVGVPLPGFLLDDGDVLPPSSYLTTPSSSVTMDYVTQLPDGYVLKGKTVESGRFQNLKLDESTKKSLEISQVLARQYYLPFWCYVDIEKLRDSGVLAGMVVRGLWRGVELERLREVSPIVHQWERVGQAYLDQKKLFESVRASEHLLNEYRIKIPSRSVYAFKIHAKVEQAITEVVRSDEERGRNVEQMILRTIKLSKSIDNSIGGRFRMSMFDAVPLRASFEDEPHGGYFWMGYGFPIPKRSVVGYFLSIFGLPSLCHCMTIPLLVGYNEG
ncbi:uncharacterized protein LOC116171596 [Photinus pyralis]|uniref:uncharacterized protein LOC116171596 n=1 Tax=Photinus pyralis TaxID=7054 RepID=UPI0012671768|nr:uncharacterized protein LOC116171596 [Photinus pyralis]